MPIPTAATITDAFLREIADGKYHDAKEVQDKLRAVFGITPEEAEQRIPSGRETVLSNRFRNAKFSMRRHNLARFEDLGNGVVITEEGRARLEDLPRTANYTTTIT